MIIYIELVLIINLILHMSIILLIRRLLYLKYSKLILFGFILDVFYMLLYIYNFMIYDLIKYIFPFVLIILSYKTNFFTYLKATIIYFLICFALGGASYVINISGNIEYVIIFIVLEFMLAIIMLFYHNKNIFNFHEISYKYRGKKYNIKAFFDTGSNIWFKNNPVIVLNRKYQFELYSEDYIEISSGLCTTKTKVYYLNEVKIDKSLISCYCIFLDIDFDAIIGPNLL